MLITAWAKQTIAAEVRMGAPDGELPEGVMISTETTGKTREISMEQRAEGKQRIHLVFPQDWKRH